MYTSKHNIFDNIVSVLRTRNFAQNLMISARNQQNLEHKYMSEIFGKHRESF